MAMSLGFMLVSSGFWDSSRDRMSFLPTSNSVESGYEQNKIEENSDKTNILNMTKKANVKKGICFYIYIECT